MAEVVGFAIPVESVVVLTEVTEDTSFRAVGDCLSGIERGPDRDLNNWICVCRRFACEQVSGVKVSSCKVASDAVGESS